MKIYLVDTLFAVALCMQLSYPLSASAADSSPITISISAKKYAYAPQQITLKKGVPVVLKLSTEDRSHGFSIPAMDLRADIEPGKVTELSIIPNKVGEFEYFCDIFCGSGHDGMSGKIKVTE